MLTVPPQLAPEFEAVSREIDELLEVHGRGREALIPVLQGLRERHNEIGDLAMQVVADRLRVPAVEVQGVVTFYAYLGMEPTGCHIIHLCRTLSCDMAGAKEVAEALSKELGIPFGGTTKDGQFTLNWANCIGMCDQAPAALADHHALGSLSVERVKEIVAGLKAKGAKK